MILRALVVCALTVICVMPRPVSAEQRTPPEATQHALDEVANAIAQGKITATPTATSTPKPTSTPQPVTSTPVPTDVPTMTATPTPGLPVVDQDNPLTGYLRPSGRGDPWLELALPQGRWDILPQDCGLYAWLTVDMYDNLTDATAFVENCQLQTWLWSSDTPCAQDDDGTCDLDLDQSYWVYLSTLPTPVPTDTPQPIVVTPRPQATRAATQPVQSRPFVSAIMPPIQPIHVADTTVPTATPEASVTKTITPTVTPTKTWTPSPTPSWTAIPPTPTVAPTNTETPVEDSKPSPVYTFLHSWQGVLAIIGVIILGILVVIVGKWAMGEH